MALVQDKSIIKSLIEQKEKELEILNFEIQKIREEIKWVVTARDYVLTNVNNAEVILSRNIVRLVEVTLKVNLYVVTVVNLKWEVDQNTTEVLDQKKCCL